MKNYLSSLGLSQTSYHNTPTRCFLFLNNFLCLRAHKQRKVPLRARARKFRLMENVNSLYAIMPRGSKQISFIKLRILSTKHTVNVYYE